MSEPKFGFVVQARMGSTRLPGKVLMDFHEGKSILLIILDLLGSHFSDVPIIVATTEKSLDDPIVELTTSSGYSVLRGDVDDVLSRFLAASEKWSLTHLVRICADNPLLNTHLIQELIDQGLSNPELDYISHRFEDGRPIIKSHLGLSAEWVKASALKKCHDMTKESWYYEHVTNFIYAHPEDFEISWLELPSNLSNRQDIRFTCDSAEDFDLLQTVFNRFREMKSDKKGLDQLVGLVDRESEMATRMRKQIKLNEK
ncbi:MAG: aminotransferase [Flavobacteriales bacterium]|nr:aminotransferase [Flavobacteriales bacterium]